MTREQVLIDSKKQNSKEERGKPKTMQCCERAPSDHTKKTMTKEQLCYLRKKTPSCEVVWKCCRKNHKETQFSVSSIISRPTARKAALFSERSHFWLFDMYPETRTMKEFHCNKGPHRTVFKRCRHVGKTAAQDPRLRWVNLLIRKVWTLVWWIRKTAVFPQQCRARIRAFQKEEKSTEVK